MKHFVKPKVTASALGNDYEFNVNIRANSEFELGVCAQLIQRMKDILVDNEIQRRGLKELYKFADKEDEEQFYDILRMSIWEELMAQGDVVLDLGRSGYRRMDGEIRQMIK